MIPPELLWLAVPYACPDADVNQSGTVNVADAQLTITHVLSGSDLHGCDVNRDGACSVADVLAAVQSIYPCEDLAAWYHPWWACEDCDWMLYRQPLGVGESHYAGRGWVVTNAGPGCVLSAWVLTGEAVTVAEGRFEAAGYPALVWNELWSVSGGCAVEVGW